MKSFGIKAIIALSVLLVFIGCNKPEWHQTLEGLYYYDKTKSGCQYSWNGSCFGDLAHGKGAMVVYDREGAEVETKKLEVYFGANTQWPYLPIKNGRFLGKTDKNNVPNGFGVLIKEDTVEIGSFKKGRLHSGNVEIFKVGDEFEAIPLYQGTMRKGLYEVGELYENGTLVYSGSWRKGKKNGFGKEYVDAELVYDGSFKKGVRSGFGKEFKNGNLLYVGEWKRGKYHGEGVSYHESGIIWYEGEWKNGLYHGKGKLYENGKCIEGKWNEGRNVKEISVTAVEQVKRTTKKWFGKEQDSSQDSVIEDDIEMAESEQEFVEALTSDLNNYLGMEFDKRVGKRFGFWHLLRMYTQPLFRSGMSRADFAQDYFVRNLSPKSMEKLINSRIDEYNKYSKEKRLCYVSIGDIPRNAIVDTDVAIKVFDRESLEFADAISGLIVDLVIINLLALLLGGILGITIDIIVFGKTIGWTAILSIPAFIICMCISIFHANPLNVELEHSISQLLTDNYLLFLDSQNLISQMLGVI